MESKSFYKHIRFQNGLYCIFKNNEMYGSYKRVEDALYERDRLMLVGWDWDLSMELVETENKYLMMDLPPFNHEPTYITIKKESWTVRGKGKNQEYYGMYYTFSDAEKVALDNDANIYHNKPVFEISKRIDGKTRYFGRFATFEDAERKVGELKKNGWKYD